MYDLRNIISAGDNQISGSIRYIAQLSNKKKIKQDRYLEFDS
jgi:hypothetical protein